MTDHINGTISAPVSVSGTLSEVAKLDGVIKNGAVQVDCTLSEALQINGYVVSTPEQLAAVLTVPERIAPTGYDFYEGDYEVTPQLHDPVVLGTDDKIMLNDVTIHEIPITRTTNPKNGITVLIG